ncbi:Ras guanine nucleotide exchange factor, putative, partial [Acanthamoeba castellanii str. Neff]
YHVPAATHSDSEVKRIQLRVCNVLKYWVSQHFDDFDHDLIQTVVNFVDESLAVDGHDSVTGVLRNAIVKRTCGLKSRVTRGRVLIVSKGSTAPAPKVGAEMVSGAGADVAMSIFDFDEEEVARQLTLREFLLY